LLPYLTFNNDTFQTSRDLLIKQFETALEKHTAFIPIEDDDTLYFSRPIQCDVIIYLFVLPVSAVTQEALDLYEEEVRFPTGQSIIKPPPMQLSGVIYSPDCGTALQWRDETAVKVEKFWRAGRVVGIAAGLIAGIQVMWVIKEMAERGSPSVSISLFEY
jgi:transmembrane E3 ubiquitin-protein ligase